MWINHVHGRQLGAKNAEPSMEADDLQISKEQPGSLKRPVQLHVAFGNHFKP